MKERNESILEGESSLSESGINLALFDFASVSAHIDSSLSQGPACYRGYKHLRFLRKTHNVFGRRT